MVQHSAKHPGFQKVAAGIAAKQGVSAATAAKELGAAKANASAKARAANPRLNRTGGRTAGRGK